MKMEKGTQLEGSFREDEESLSKDEFKRILKEAEILEKYQKILSKDEVSKIANELYNDREGKSAEDIKNEIYEKLGKAEKERILKDFGLDSIMKNYMKELESAVESKDELEKIREEIIEKLFSEYNENLYNSARVNDNINKMGKDLGTLFNNHLKDIKKAA